MKRCGRRIWVVALVCLAWGHTAAAQPRKLTLDVIADPTARASFSGSAPTGLVWMDDSHYVWSRRGDSGAREWLKVDAVSGRSEPLFDVARAASALETALPPRPSRGQVRISNIIFNPTFTAGLLDEEDDLYLLRLSEMTVTRLTQREGDEEEATFSPDGQRVAFVRHNNLFSVDVRNAKESQLTKDGSPRVLNGKLDWLYQEEIYGRGRFRGYWWSPDSRRLAFLRLDQSRVPDFPIVDHLTDRPTLEVTPYPNAGEPNPSVRLASVNAAGGSTTWIDLKGYDPEILVVNVAWGRDSSQLFYQVQNREQTWLDLNAVPAGGGRPRTLFREQTPAWVEAIGDPVWLRDGSFVWQSDRSGYRHLYHYTQDGTLIRPITSGAWDVRALLGSDPASTWIYFTASERSAITRDVYRVALDGGRLTRLSQPEGSHRPTFNPGFTRYLDSWSAALSPTQVRLHGADGTEQRVIDANPVPAIHEFGLVRPEFLTVPARDGFQMHAMLIKPPDFDPSRRYPVYQETYAGPGAQSVLNAWTGPSHLFLQWLAQSGVVVWVCDNRSASGKGVVSQWPVYGRMGDVELEDIEDGIAWLTRQPWVDPARIALGGWSYGGFMTAYALTHSTRFAGGIIGAPVTDWRLYDSVYTERYMKLPIRNQEGYDRSSVLKAAGELKGRALVIHGLTDDNVHLQNSVKLAYELQKAGKAFELMVYPRSRHGITDPLLHKHNLQVQYDFLMRTLVPTTPAPTTHPVSVQ